MARAAGGGLSRMALTQFHGCVPKGQDLLKPHKAEIPDIHRAEIGAG
jgi:hypothetical protein